MAPNNNDWQPAGKPYDWKYPFSPIFSCQNLPRPNSFWGYPDVMPSVIELNDALNLVQSSINIERKIRRILVGRGMGEGTIRAEPAKIMQTRLPDHIIQAVHAAIHPLHVLAFSANL